MWYHYDVGSHIYTEGSGAFQTDQSLEAGSQEPDSALQASDSMEPKNATLYCSSNPGLPMTIFSSGNWEGFSRANNNVSFP